MTKQERNTIKLQNDKIAAWLQITPMTVRTALKAKPESVTALLVHQCKERIENGLELYHDIDIIEEFAKTFQEFESFRFIVDQRHRLTFITLAYGGKIINENCNLGAIYAINQFLECTKLLDVRLEQPKNIFELLVWNLKD